MTKKKKTKRKTKRILKRNPNKINFLLHNDLIN